MLTTKTTKATVGGLNPSKGYTLQIFELTSSEPILLARRDFMSESSVLPTPARVGVSDQSGRGWALGSGPSSHTSVLGSYFLPTSLEPIAVPRALMEPGPSVPFLTALPSLCS